MNMNRRTKSEKGGKNILQKPVWTLDTPPALPSHRYQFLRFRFFLFRRAFGKLCFSLSARKRDRLQKPKAISKLKLVMFRPFFLFFCSFLLFLSLSLCVPLTNKRHSPHLFSLVSCRAVLVRTLQAWSAFLFTGKKQNGGKSSAQSR